MLVADFLSKTYPNNIIVDLARFAAILLGGSVATFTVLELFRWHWGWPTPSDRTKRFVARLVAYSTLGLIAAITEWTQLGKPWLWWRLPLLIVGVFSAMYSIRLEGKSAREDGPPTRRPAT